MSRVHSKHLSFIDSEIRFCGIEARAVTTTKNITAIKFKSAVVGKPPIIHKDA